MSFFQSEVVRAEMAEIQELQEEVYSNVFEFPQMQLEDQKYHINILERLLEKQKIMYTRLSLSDDPQAKKMKEEIWKGAAAMGLPSDVDINVLFNNMTQSLNRRFISTPCGSPNIDADSTMRFFISWASGSSDKLKRVYITLCFSQSLSKIST